MFAKSSILYMLLVITVYGETSYATRASSSPPVNLRVETQGVRNSTAPLLYGLMFEDISRSIDGGLYGELLINRALAGAGNIYGPINGYSIPGYNRTIGDSVNAVRPLSPTPYGYRAIGLTKVSLDVFHPLSNALPNVLQVDVQANATGNVGFSNDGFWGISVTPQIYNVSFYLLSGSGSSTAVNLTSVTASIVSNSTGETWASVTIPATNLSDFSYQHFKAQIHNTATAPSVDNVFTITFNSTEVLGATMYFGLISLFPETYRGRANGMRKDLAEALELIQPKFLRFPGGSDLEGLTVATRFKWEQTIGPLIDRPGRPSLWTYYNNEGFGLLEFLQWTEDMSMEPVLGIYAGYSLDGVSYPESEMDQVLNSALDELEYCTGNVSTYWGSLRATHGHPKPFKVQYVEIGNEEFLSSTYPYRWAYLRDGLKKAHPDITLISTAYADAEETLGYTIPLVSGEMYDSHDYRTPNQFIDAFGLWDNWQASNNLTNVTVLIGEYSNWWLDTNITNAYELVQDTEAHVYYPELISVISEAVWLLGAERNPNTVKMTAYAPTLANMNANQWTPNSITFNANPNDTIISASAHLQAMFSAHRGTESIPVHITAGDFNPLYWASSMDSVQELIYLKVVNTNASAVSLKVAFDTTISTVNGTILTNPNLRGFNFINNLTAISPAPIIGLQTAVLNGTFDWSVPPYSVNVLQFGYGGHD